MVSVKRLAVILTSGSTGSETKTYLSERHFPSSNEQDIKYWV